jgi:hypothetical protein
MLVGLAVKVDRLTVAKGGGFDWRRAGGWIWVGGSAVLGTGFVGSKVWLVEVEMLDTVDAGELGVGCPRYSELGGVSRLGRMVDRRRAGAGMIAIDCSDQYSPGLLTICPQTILAAVAGTVLLVRLGRERFEDSGVEEYREGLRSPRVMA